MQLVRDQRWRGQEFVGFPFHHARDLIVFLAHTCPMRNLESGRRSLQHTIYLQPCDLAFSLGCGPSSRIIVHHLVSCRLLHHSSLSPSSAFGTSMACLPKVGPVTPKPSNRHIITVTNTQIQVGSCHCCRHASASRITSSAYHTHCFYAKATQMHNMSTYRLQVLLTCSRPPQ